MSDNGEPARSASADDATALDILMADGTDAPRVGFTTTFRGYDRDEVDEAVAALREQVQAATDQVSALKRRAGAAVAQSRGKAERLEAELAAATAQSREALEEREAHVAAATAQSRDAVVRLESELAAATARAAAAEQRVTALTDELVETSGESPSRHQFEEVLRVAEEQAGVLLRNATVQGERLLEAARVEIDNRRKDAHAEADAIIAHAQHDAQQARLRIETELTAHEARIDREAAHAAEKASQAEREAAAIRSEAEKGAAALRSMVARETAHARTEAEEAVRELRVRALDFEASLTRRQDDAQQEFLVLHNQAVAHAERITQDANAQVAASLDHAQRVAAKADDFERLMRAQAQQIEADAHLRAREQLDQARLKAERIIELVTTHSQSVLRDAEDRTRQLRWQQHQLTSFMAEVREMIRPDAAPDAGDRANAVTEAPAGDEAAAAASASDSDPALGDGEAAVTDESADDVDAELAELVDQAASENDQG